MLSDPVSIRQTLLDWASSGVLRQATLSEDGATLGYQEAVLPGPALVAVESAVDASKSCTYSVASLYLQLIDPDQGLLIYRNACKKYEVKDPIKASDKATVLAFFLPSSSNAVASTSASAETPAEAVAGAAAVLPMEAPLDQQKKEARVVDENQASSKAASLSQPEAAAKKGDERHRHHKDKHHRDRDHKKSKKPSEEAARPDKKKSRSSQPPPPASSPPAKKKRKTFVTNEELFQHLRGVVDRRNLAPTAPREAAPAAAAAAAASAVTLADLTQALSTQGWELTPELLAEDQERTALIRSREIPVGNSASILRAVDPKKDLTRALELLNETMNPASTSAAHAKDRPGGGKGSSSSSTIPSSLTSPAAKKIERPYLIGQKPVIVVPKGMTAPITMINALEFLSKGQFVPRGVMLKQGRAPRSTGPVTFTRPIRRAVGTGEGLNSHQPLPLEFEIVDNPLKLGYKEREWERIVAVVVLGHSWQFKDWLSPSYNAPATLFDRVYGIYIGLEGDQLPAEVPSWAVERATLNRDKRGLDSVTFASFWNQVEEFMRVRKPELLLPPSAASGTEK